MSIIVLNTETLEAAKFPEDGIAIMVDALRPGTETAEALADALAAVAGITKQPEQPTGQRYVGRPDKED